jgi:hypothetical protein
VFAGDSNEIDEAATRAKRAELARSGDRIVERDNEDRGSETPPEGLYFTEGRLFPLRCC